MGVSTVDVVGAAEFVDVGQTALLSGVQQGGVAPQQVLDVRVALLHQVQGRVPVTVLLGGVCAVLGGRREEGGGTRGWFSLVSPDPA